MSGPKPILAQFIKSDRCSAEGLEVRANAPALAMWRKLLEAGYDPERPLHCFRGETLAMKVSSIAYGARYSVSEPSTGSGVRLVPYSDGLQKSGAAPLQLHFVALRTWKLEIKSPVVFKADDRWSTCLILTTVALPCPTQNTQHPSSEQGLLKLIAAETLFDGQSGMDKAHSSFGWRH